MLTDTHLMVDIETLGSKNDAVIASIGAFAKIHCIDEETKEISTVHECGFYNSAYIHRGLNTNRSIDPRTVLFWLQQDRDAIDSTFFPKPVDEMDARSNLEQILLYLKEFIDFVRKKSIDNKRKVLVWANGATFDFPIIRNAYEQHDAIDCPWSYKEEMCLRPMRQVGKMFGLDFSNYKVGNVHDALEDCKNQHKFLLDVLTILDKEREERINAKRY